MIAISNDAILRGRLPRVVRSLSPSFRGPWVLAGMPAGSSPTESSTDAMSLKQDRHRHIVLPRGQYKGRA
jgi:hypothetical protein